MTPTPASIPKRPASEPEKTGISMNANYEFDSREYWVKRSMKRQHIIDSQNETIQSLETRLMELEEENINLKRKEAK